MMDNQFVRSQFPAFSDSSLVGWAFFENAGGSYTCQQVIDKLTNDCTKTKMQPYASYLAAQNAGAQIEAGQSGETMGDRSVDTSVRFSSLGGYLGGCYSISLDVIF